MCAVHQLFFHGAVQLIPLVRRLLPNNLIDLLYFLPSHRTSPQLGPPRVVSQKARAPGQGEEVRVKIPFFYPFLCIEYVLSVSQVDGRWWWALQASVGVMGFTVVDR